MPTTRGKIIKTVYKNEDDSDPDESGDFSDSGSEANITEQSLSSEDEEENCEQSSDETKKFKKSNKAKTYRKKVNFAKNFINKIKHREDDSDKEDNGIATFSVKDLTDADKLLPSVLNLSESGNLLKFITYIHRIPIFFNLRVCYKKHKSKVWG